MRSRVSGCANTALWWLAAGAVTLAAARELDPAACGARFDVQRDKIIRTEESREMGARYLSELDVGARHECLRLCCETDSCDVFVYEEKSPGSCYLFNCGPPEDFRCKFTAHGNFSSGVLALSRRLAELQDQERLARRDPPLASLTGLTNLRGATSSTAAPPAGRAPDLAPAPAPAPRPAPAPQPPPARPPDPPPGRCSRYQFECRRGGECIAVYNACDGVPQCADGSDEAPELGCPAPAPAAPAAPEHPAQSQPSSPPPESPPPPPPFKPMQAGEGMEGMEGLSAGPLAAGAERWPHRLAQAQPPRRYPGAGAEEAPHIFAHKGGLVGAGAAPPQYAPFEPPWRHLWPQPPGAEWAPAGPGPWAEDPRRAWPVPPPPPPPPRSPPPPEVPMYVPAKTMPEMPPAYSGQQQTLRDAPKKGPEPPPPTAPRPAPTAAPAARDRDAAHVKEQHHESGAPRAGTAAAGAEAEAEAAAAAAAHADERDGLSDHPPAAILLLVLGVAMTAVLGAMAGCRARAARRRLRRGKAPLAHDADYLVNGMYL